MDTIVQLLQARLEAASAQLPGAEGAPAVATIQNSTDARFGDYQTNAAMILAKQRKMNPRALAQEIIGRLDVAEMCETPEIAGAGFINFRLKPEWVAKRFSELLADEAKLGVPVLSQPKTLVIDFSSPNVAKPMHVGHIRSTILGDAISRIAEFLGWKVVRDNHIGDWGTQFGMLLHGWKTELNRTALEADPLSEMERIYKLISARSKAEPETLAAVHAELVKLQAGDAENLALWHEMIRLSQVQFDDIYRRLNIRFDVTLGESFYNDQLQKIVSELRERGIARESEGALCIFTDGAVPPEQDPFLIKDKEGWRDNPAIILKKDGGANYSTTDLATMRYRIATWHPQAIVVCTDGRQQLHFRQIVSAFTRWKPEEAATVRFSHVWFGSILGEDGKPFKTRSGENIRLTELLDEAIERALAVVTTKNPELPAEEAREIARKIGLGAVKYADLAPNRQSDYTFSWDRMLSFQGNTAPYLQNAYVRIQAIFRKAATVDGAGGEEAVPVTWTAPDEITLAKTLMRFGEVVPAVLDDYRPNLLATYLFELANTFHSFYEACPVLKAESPARETRLALCTATARVLKKGLELLGIEAPERM